eukprot:76953-Rhodomonas_salina.1
MTYICIPDVPLLQVRYRARARAHVRYRERARAHVRYRATWCIPNVPKMTQEMTVGLLRQLQKAEWEDEQVLSSRMGEHIDANRSLRISEFNGAAAQFEIEERDVMTSWQEMAVYRRK